jgi:heme-degrading monooxygenase HmoA
MYVRVTRIRGDLARVGAASAWFQEELLQELEHMDGFMDAMLLVDHDHGETLALTFWDSMDSLRATEERARELRAEAATRNGGSVTHVERFELVVQASSLREPH